MLHVSNSALRRTRQKDHSEFKVSVGYTARSCLKQTNRNRCTSSKGSNRKIYFIQISSKLYYLRKKINFKSDHRAQWLECFSHNCEDQCSDFQSPHKYQVGCGDLPVILMLRNRDRGALEQAAQSHCVNALRVQLRTSASRAWWKSYGSRLLMSTSGLHTA